MAGGPDPAPADLVVRGARLPHPVGGLAAGRPCAVIGRGSRIAAVVPEAGRDTDLPAAAATVDIDGAVLLPAFVDAHVHVTETGLLLDGVDLTSARTTAEVLAAVAAAARARPGVPVLGHGWDELRLAGGRPPSGSELGRAAAGGEVYLSRVDVHSAVVSPALAARAGAAELPGWTPDGRVERDAHHAVRRATRYTLAPTRRHALQDLALRAFAAAGIGVVEEMSAPHVAPEDDLTALWELTVGTAPQPAAPARPRVVPYRGELVDAVEQARALARRWRPVPLAGLGGDLMVDGSIGSRTAALRAGYADAPEQRGHLYLSPRQIGDHVAACTTAGLRAGFHVIGDAGADAVVEGFRRAERAVGVAALRAAGHRLEHLEMPDAEGIAALAALGVGAGVQPAFDAAWGGPDGMYAARLGRERAAAMNPFAALAAAGVRLVLGSDSPVTPARPWEAIRAAALHRTPEHRLTARAAWAAHTGAITRLLPGGEFTAAAWPGPPAGPGDLLDALLADLTVGLPGPVCRLTVVAGRVAHLA